MSFRKASTPGLVRGDRAQLLYRLEYRRSGKVPFQVTGDEECVAAHRRVGNGVGAVLVFLLTGPVCDAALRS